MPGSQRSFLFLKKGSFYAFLSPAPPLPIPINPCHQVVIYIRVPIVVSAFSKGALLKLVSHFHDDGLFQSFHNLLFGLGELNVILSQSKVRLWSLITCFKLELAIASPEECFWIESYKLFYDSNVVCLTFVPHALLTCCGAIGSNCYNIIRLSLL